MYFIDGDMHACIVHMHVIEDFHIQISISINTCNAQCQWTARSNKDSLKCTLYALYRAELLICSQCKGLASLISSSAWHEAPQSSAFCIKVCSVISCMRQHVFVRRRVLQAQTEFALVIVWYSIHNKALHDTASVTDLWGRTLRKDLADCKIYEKLKSVHPTLCRRAAVLDPGNSKAALLEGIAQEELKRTQQQKYKTGCA